MVWGGSGSYTAISSSKVVSGSKTLPVSARVGFPERVVSGGAGRLKLCLRPGVSVAVFQPSDILLLSIRCVHIIESGRLPEVPCSQVRHAWKKA